jgi:hypothetical protein
MKKIRTGSMVIPSMEGQAVLARARLTREDGIARRCLPPEPLADQSCLRRPARLGIPVSSRSGRTAAVISNDTRRLMSQPGQNENIFPPQGQLRRPPHG